MRGNFRSETSFLDAYVLEDGRRLLHKRGMARGLGLKSDGGNAFMKTISRPAIGSKMSPDLWRKIENPIVFKPLGGDPAHGYEGTILIEVCDAIIQARNEGALRASQIFLAAQAEMIIKGSAAKIGIMGLIDEATGYSDNNRNQRGRSQAMLHADAAYLLGMSFHEAGHAVVAWSLGVEVGDIHICGIGEGERRRSDRLR